MRRNGVVILFGAKNFGFIREFKTKKDYLVHISDVIGGKELHTGDRVTFELGHRPRLIRKDKTDSENYSPQATKVDLISE
jgi:cold shock CspA family protein